MFQGRFTLKEYGHGMNNDRLVLTCARGLSLTLALACAAPAGAQLRSGVLPGVGGGLPGGLGLGRIDPGHANLASPRLPRTPMLPVRPPQVLDPAGNLVAAPLTEIRRLVAERLLREHPDLLEGGDDGQPVVRGDILAIGVSGETLSRLRKAGFDLRSRSELEDLGIQGVVLGAPRGLSAVEALRRARALDPGGQYDLDPIYLEAGGAGRISLEAGGAGRISLEAGGVEGVAGWPRTSPVRDLRGVRIGLVDGSAAESEPALARATLVQRPFAPGGAQLSAHATAVASLIVGSGRNFRGAAAGATLYVADVYGATAAGGSAEAVARGLAWLVRSKTPVINISLVGPPNLLLEAAVRSVMAKGGLVVAAVGNDGPAAPPLYPAAYPGVIAVTGVDSRGHVLPEAGRGTHVDFAAPGSDMAAAGIGGGYVSVRGTSFAAPIVAGRLAALRSTETVAQAVDALARGAAHLGGPGLDPAYGHGLVGAELRTDPAVVRPPHR